MNDELLKEVDKLIAFWLAHSCDECNDDPDSRFPTKSYPAIFRFFEKRKIYRKELPKKIHKTIRTDLMYEGVLTDDDIRWCVDEIMKLIDEAIE